MADAPISEELTALKKRARRRLVGAVVLVMTALVVLWTVMDDKPPQSLTTQSVAIVSSTPSLASTVTPTPVSPKPAPAAPVVTNVPPPLNQPTVVAPPPVATTPPAVSTTVDKPAAVMPTAESTPKATSEKSVDEKPVDRKQAHVKDPAKILAGIGEEEATKPTKPATADVAKAAGHFFLQLGAFADAAKADGLVSKAHEAGVAVHTDSVSTAKGVLTRLRAGPYADRPAAEKAHNKLASAGISSTIVSK